MKENKKLIIYSLIALVSLSIIYILASRVIPQAIVTMTKAAPATKASMENSRLLGTKILAKADGVDKCIVNVFVMDNTSKGVPDKRVELIGMEGIKSLMQRTDKDGKITFEMASVKPGQFRLTATIEGIELSQDLRVTFR